MTSQTAAYVEKWTHRLNTAGYDMKLTAAEKLGKVKDPNAVKALSESLFHGPQAVRAMAAKSLGKIGNPSAVPALVKLLDSPHSAVACAAADSLGQIGDKSAVPALTKVLKTYKTGNRHKQIHGFDRGVYTSAANALKKIDNSKARHAIAQYYC